jgi:hypothetical protein
MLSISFRRDRRLERLLPWLNAELTPLADVREILSFFLGPSSEAQPGQPLLVSVDSAPPDLITQREADQLRRTLCEILECIVPDQRADNLPKSVVLPLGLSSLEYFVHPRKRPASRLMQEVPAEARAQSEQSAVLLVRGTLPDLVLFRLLQLLTTPDAGTVGQCRAPLPNDRSQRCGHFFMASGGRPGRRAMFCSNDCRIRFHNSIGLSPER